MDEPGTITTGIRARGCPMEDTGGFLRFGGRFDATITTGIVVIAPAFTRSRGVDMGFTEDTGRTRRREDEEVAGIIVAAEKKSIYYGCIASHLFTLIVIVRLDSFQVL